MKHCLFLSFGGKEVFVGSSSKTPSSPKDAVVSEDCVILTFRSSFTQAYLHSTWWKSLVISCQCQMWHITGSRTELTQVIYLGFWKSVCVCVCVCVCVPELRRSWWIRGELNACAYIVIVLKHFLMSNSTFWSSCAPLHSSPLNVFCYIHLDSMSYVAG